MLEDMFNSIVASVVPNVENIPINEEKKLNKPLESFIIVEGLSGNRIGLCLVVRP